MILKNVRNLVLFYLEAKYKINNNPIKPSIIVNIFSCFFSLFFKKSNLYISNIYAI